MKLKERKLYVLLLSGLFFSLALQAQQTDFYRSPADIYRKANELYQQGNYGAAEKMFTLYLGRLPEKQNLKAENAAYFAAQCAVKLSENDALERLNRFLTLYPESVWAPSVEFSMGEAYFNNRQYSRALKVFDNLRVENLNRKQQLQYAYEKGYCLLKMKKTEQALPLFRKVMNTQSPYAAPAAYYYAYTQYRLGHDDEALAAFSLIKDERRFKKSIPLLMMQLYYRQGAYDSVVDYGKKYLPAAGYRQKAEMNRLMANSYYEKGDYTAALPYFTAYEGLARHNIQPEESYRLGYTYFVNQKYAEAISRFQDATQVKQAEVAQNAWFYLGQCYLKTGQLVAAQNAFVRAYELNKNNATGAEALLAYARVTLHQKGDNGHDPFALIHEFINNPHVSNANRSKAAALLAQLYVNTHNGMAALSSIERTGIKEKSLQQAFQKLAFSQAADFYGRRDYVHALTYFKKAAKYSADGEVQRQAMYWQASCYYHLGQYPASVRAYKIFLTSRGTSATSLYIPAFYDLAYSYFKEKNYRLAIQWFQRFLNKKYDNPVMVEDARLRIADSYTLLENYAAAHPWYEKVIHDGGRYAAYALYEDAFCYGAQGRFSQKVKVLQKLVNTYPKSGYYLRALYDLASTYASSLNEPRQAIVYFQRIVKESPASSYARLARVKMGLLYYKNNQYAQAIRQLKSVIAAFPASGEAKVALSTLESIYKDMGNPSAYFAYARTLSFVQVSKSQEDSLTFAVGEDAYLAGNCGKTERALHDYLNRFPNGGFKVKSWHYLAACYARQKDTAQALHWYEKIIGWPLNDYTLPSLVKAARMEYALKNYEKAAAYYQKVLPLAEDPSLKLEALDGQMRAFSLSGKWQQAAQAARALIRMPEVSEDQTVYAHYVLAKAALKAGNGPQAEREFAITDKLDKGALGAESKYYLALMAFQKKNYDEAEKRVYALSDKYPSEVYWVAKGFILLADVYVARGNIFQARETLKSIVANYPGNDLKQVARQNLAQLPGGKAPANSSHKPQKKK